MSYNQASWPHNGFRVDFPRSPESREAQTHRLAVMERAAAELVGQTVEVDTTLPEQVVHLHQFPFCPEDN